MLTPLFSVLLSKKELVLLSGIPECTFLYMKQW